MSATPTIEQAQRVLDVVNCGLVYGLGNPKPGECCVEAAVCYALGEPHSDRPTCVHRVVRDIKVSINDAPWSSNKARAAGLRRVAIAGLGTAGTLDVEQFKREFRVAVTARVVPLFLDAAAKIARRSKDEKQAAKIEAVAEMCRRGMSPEDARKEMRALHPRAYAYANADAYANANANAFVNADADAYANAYADAYADANANAYADANANAYADANANANADANANANADANAQDKFLGAVADSVEAALRACDSPGIALLDQLLPLAPATEPVATPQP